MQDRNAMLRTLPQVEEVLNEPCLKQALEEFPREMVVEAVRSAVSDARQGILAGTVLAFARALGEYGATSMIAGYTPGRTATISTTVYQLWRTNDDAMALKWVLVNMAISFVVLLAVNMLEKRERRGRKERAA